ncbi:hypothetical protein [Flavobacterium johnsoniae]|uniref:Uncharacterized protein n=1 Tax=Flavobacterium johnsoniae (strain ATCC 17061 / DSM 2064 / JCM 8514 / BCRC 14874 / CCUG 350202 / NBRC 14942 / NCIMB 11054 / UW101) TaxID=376686 RepID=A5FBP3_FLAJ1|nr:hypothetical protein [Flavobacterium johnsoniae]ABQ07376.1 hypothetical protein Fjoh_4369 [Flavobacterium johnsoniae UW101]OXE99289.1 hypothetical protein B0A63_11900 [Flavobacterium johnsoniae UW101]WQG80788.1 hypothetical protein SR927_22575 [Flavobacterium johnsoniae UW101]SHL14816.1 hypothetical protein SAMN05444146_3131 [Flavobacterium johnsoniae]
MNNSRGLLYPALHKFYSALSSLEKFKKGTNFFDNISFLDNFFSEYRNVTFVLQKSLAKTQFMPTYEELRDQYLVNNFGKWFVEKRNEVIKQQPFDLEKRIVISIYSGQIPLSLPELIFTIDNDVEISTIVESLRTTFMNSGQLEVMFSAEFLFFEYGHSEDLYDNLILGINQMKLFLAEMKKAINEDCKLSDELERKIDKMNFYQVPKDMLFVDDYVFYCKKEYFEKASRVALQSGSGQIRVPIENLNEMYPNGDLFSKFELMHVVIFQMGKSLLPTYLILYSDDTFELVTFGFSIKTTVYRKFNEIARRIEADKIVNVLFVTEMYIYDLDEVSKLDSRERIEHAKNEILAFYMIDKHLAIKSHSYDTKQINDFKYISSIMFSKSSERVLPRYMNPVMQEFIRLKTNLK